MAVADHDLERSPPLGGPPLGMPTGFLGLLVLHRAAAASSGLDLSCSYPPTRMDRLAGPALTHGARPRRADGRDQHLWIRGPSTLLGLLK